MTELKRSGGCLCGDIKFNVNLCEPEIHVCHCTICQKWHGAMGHALKCESDWSIEGEENMRWFDSSEWGQRSFCKNCGTHLFFRTKDGGYYGSSAGALDKQDGLKIGAHIYVDKKPAYMQAKDDSPQLTEKEFLESIGEA